MRKNKVDIITLGCSKNLVDSEQLMRQFVANGYTVEHDPHKINGEIVVVNTCGFIGDAQEESINMILELGEQKQKGRIGKLFVMGCLSERFLKDLEKELPEVDRFYGKFNWMELISDLGKSYHQELATERVLTTPRHYAYVKIGGGMQPYLFLLLDPDHNRGLSIPSDGRDRRRGSWLGGARRKRIPDDRPRSYVLWPRSL